MQPLAVRWACELPPQAPAEIEAAADLVASGSPYAREDGFHARFSAIARTYHYLLYNHPVRSPLLSGRVGWVFRPVSLQSMLEGARHLVGTHDFSAFRSIECQAKTPVRSMHALDILQSGDMFIFTLCANAFLHHMVRNIVGSLIMVGQGKQAPDWIAEVLAQRDRSKAAPTFMADGLYLARVDYPAQWQAQLPQQRTRDGWPWGQGVEALQALI
jgi:tRNA pseudouridine38-40 synthase